MQPIPLILAQAGIQKLAQATRSPLSRGRAAQLTDRMRLRLSNRSKRLALAAKPDHHVDAGDLVAFRRHRRLADHDVGGGNVEQIVLLLR